MNEATPISIREATAGDAAAVAGLWTEAYVAEGQGGRSAPYVERDLLAVTDAGTVLVAELRGSVVGVVALRLRLDGDLPKARIRL